MESVTRGFPPGDLRVSDADRDRAVAELSEHYQAGRLTAGEFDDRSGRALQARTGNELSELFTDLPKAPVPAGSTPPASPRPVVAGGWLTLPTGRLILLCVIAGIVASSVLGSFSVGHHGGFGLLVPIIVLAVIVRRRHAGR